MELLQDYFLLQVIAYAMVVGLLTGILVGRAIWREDW